MKRLDAIVIAFVALYVAGALASQGIAEIMASAILAGIAALLVYAIVRKLLRA